MARHNDCCMSHMLLLFKVCLALSLWQIIGYPELGGTVRKAEEQLMLSACTCVFDTVLHIILVSELKKGESDTWAVK